MQTLALAWGILAFLAVRLALMPCLGALNWLNLPFAGLGLVLGIVSVVKGNPASKGLGIAGIVLCAIAILAGAVRLVLGGGVL